MAGQAFAERRRRGAQPGRDTPGADDPLPRAVDAMGRAAGELDRLQTAKSLPHEEEALGQLLKAAAEIRRRQVQRQQAQGGGGGNGNRQQPDLSTLFDQELRKKQETNYETPATSETKNDQPQADDPLASIRELARRQEALSRQQKELAKNKDQLTEEELKRQLERLTRDQEELRKQAEELAQSRTDKGRRPKAARCGHRRRDAQCVEGAGAAGSATGQRARRPRDRSNCAASNSRCRAPVPTSGAGRLAICSSKRGSSPTPNAGWATNRRRPLRAPPAKTRAAGWPPNRNGSPTAPID